MVYTEKVCICLFSYDLRIHMKDNISNEVFFTPAEILVRCVMPPE